MLKVVSYDNKRNSTLKDRKILLSKLINIKKKSYSLPFEFSESQFVITKARSNSSKT